MGTSMTIWHTGLPFLRGWGLGTRLSNTILVTFCIPLALRKTYRASPNPSFHVRDTESNPRFFFMGYSLFVKGSKEANMALLIQDAGNAWHIQRYTGMC